MNKEQIIKNVIRRSLVNESRRKEPLDELVDGKKLFDMMFDIHDVIRDLARPIYGVRQQKENLDKLVEKRLAEEGAKESKRLKELVEKEYANRLNLLQQQNIIR